MIHHPAHRPLVHPRTTDAAHAVPSPEQPPHLVLDVDGRLVDVDPATIFDILKWRRIHGTDDAAHALAHVLVELHLVDGWEERAGKLYVVPSPVGEALQEWSERKEGPDRFVNAGHGLAGCRTLSHLLSLALDKPPTGIELFERTETELLEAEHWSLRYAAGLTTLETKPEWLTGTPHPIDHEASDSDVAVDTILVLLSGAMRDEWVPDTSIGRRLADGLMDLGLVVAREPSGSGWALRFPSAED